MESRKSPPINRASLLALADTLAKVRDLLQERYGIDREKVEMSAQLSSLGLDSLSLIECAFDLEKSLNVTLSDLPHEVFTIGDLVRYVSDVRERTVTATAGEGNPQPVSSNSK